MPTAHEPEIVVKELWQAIDAKDQLIARGDLVNLDDLDTQIKAFCTLLGTLPPNDARRFEEDLKKIMDKLIDWSTVLEARKNQLGGEARNLNTQSKAQTAYMTTSSFKKPQNDA